ncbi:hypothetical protein [Litoreibacter roseus]|uniref:Cyclodipeptide synthase n=1 Tax=Litoreibacter roseus TaxID=2601869 RepID=A0A6N6JF15_9RHOB|nr:hypothetical protein [Litoreibacter roseus]GFE64941.1 hypothetical protein KIN_20150 [Litoreibacter roseus]
MYSARIVNSLADTKADITAQSIAERLPATESTLTGMGGVLTNRTGDFDLAGRDAWIFISIKNRGFNRPYIDRFIDMCEASGINGHICPVDDPYRYNSMAELKCDELPEEELAKIERLSSDIGRMVQKAINGKRTKRVDIVKWRDLERETPPIYRAELTRAFKDRTRIRDFLYDHVSSVKPVETERDFERYAEFFLCEVPVLMHTYYAHGATLDIYPGPQPKFFWQIELGQFEAELPEMTAMTRGERPMLYLDTHNRGRAGK